VPASSPTGERASPPGRETGAEVFCPDGEGSQVPSGVFGDPAMNFSLSRSAGFGSMKRPAIADGISGWRIRPPETEALWRPGSAQGIGREGLTRPRSVPVPAGGPTGISLLHALAADMGDRPWGGG
jgi:hypothetical protein